MADLSLSIHSNKTRLTSFPSKLDQYNSESFKKIPLSQSYDWGMLAITNTDVLLLYNKDKSSLVVFDANGNENEVRREEEGIKSHMIKIVCLAREFNGPMEKSKIYVFIMMIVSLLLANINKQERNHWNVNCTFVV